LGVGLAAAQPGQVERVADAEVILEVVEPGRPGEVPEAEPPRFVLLETRRVYVGGSSEILTAQLDKRDVKPIQKMLKDVRKIKDLGASVVLGSGEREYRLWRRDGRPQSVVARGNPARAPRGLRPLARLLMELEAFHHSRLRPFRPSQYELRVVESDLPGGCRRWDVGLPLPEARSGSVRVPAEAFVGWPTGRWPASVCGPVRRLLVTLRPLLPGETP
jgi:hypothetical protein